MLFSARDITLRDGRTATLRVAEPDDALQMIEYLKATAAETEFVLRYPEECAFTEDRERELLEQFKSAPNSLMLCCFVDGRLAGNCNLLFYDKIKIRHRASAAIALYRAYWGLGIGTAMFEAMIEVARERGAALLELEYIDGNDRARALYEKMGFVRVAEHPDAVRLKDGSSRSMIFMTKKL